MADERDDLDEQLEALVAQVQSLSRHIRPTGVSVYRNVPLRLVYDEMVTVHAGAVSDHMTAHVFEAAVPEPYDNHELQRPPYFCVLCGGPVGPDERDFCEERACKEKRLEFLVLTLLSKDAHAAFLAVWDGEEPEWGWVP